MNQLTLSEAEYQTKKSKIPRNLSRTNGHVDSLETAGEERSALLPKRSGRTASCPVVFHAARSLYAIVL